jgi:hypothetical protein
LLAHAASSKLRYVLFAARLNGRGVPNRLLAVLLPLTLIDFAVWAAPIFDMIDPERHERW